MSETSKKASLQRLLGTSNVVGAMLRAVSIAGKLAFLAYLARYHGPAELGVYGLLAASTGIAVQALGLELHNHALREVVAASNERRRTIVSSQLALYAGTQAVGLCVLGVAVGLGWLAPDLAPWLAIIVITSHLSQEAHRLLIGLSRPEAAYWVNAVAQGLWVFPVMAAGLMWPALRTRWLVLCTWSLFGMLAVVLGAVLLRRAGVLGPLVRTDWNFVARGLRVGLVLLVSSICFQFIDVGDRYVIEWFGGLTQVGAYALYASIARTMRDLVYAGVVVVHFPRMVASAGARDFAALRAQGKELTRRSLKASLVSVPAFGAIAYVAGRLSGRTEIAGAVVVVPILLAASVITNASLGAHYTLYALRKDGVVAITHAAALVLGGGACVLFVRSGGLIGAALGTCFAFTVSGLVTQWYAHRVLAATS